MVLWEYTLLFILYIIERTDGSRTVRTQQFVSRSSLVKVQKKHLPTHVSVRTVRR